MSRFLTSMLQRSKNHTIAISTRGAAWVDVASDQRSRRQQVMWGEKQNPTTAMQLLKDQIKLPDEEHIDWIVAPSLLRHWLQTPPVDIQSLGELHAVAQARAFQLFGAPMLTETTPAPTWVVAGDWHATQSFLCCAMPNSWQETLQDKAKGNTRHQIYSPLQLVLRSFKRQLPALGWLALVIADALYLICFEKNQIQYLRGLPLSPALVPTDLQSLAMTEWRREMLRTNKLSDQLHYLNVTHQKHTSRMPLAGLKLVEWTPRGNILDIKIQQEFEQIVGLHELEQTLWCAMQCLGNNHV